ncbi:MAG: hypothetical protein WAW17_16940 [Rhodococcus sp. (in: high G+C Gram-positive bacteria)]|uniref:hypothetical protein n=1 Tax=Rhodococcus sp. TaxID=1831 RepID=UPI003BAEC1C2
MTPVDSQQLATFLLGAWNGVYALSSRLQLAGTGPDDVRDCLDQARRIFLAGLAADSARDVQLLPVPRPGEIEQSDLPHRA